MSLESILKVREGSKGSLNITGLTLSASAYLISAFKRKNPKEPIGIICSTPEVGVELLSNLRFFSDKKTSILYLPEPDVLPYGQISPDSAIWAKRIETLRLLEEGRGDLIIAPISSALRRLPPRGWIVENQRELREGQKIDRDDLTSKLVELGYLNSPIVEDIGEFSVRGAILDLWSAGYDLPMRLEFDGEELSTIREFDPTTQRSKGYLNKGMILPVNEISFNRNALKETTKRIHDICVEKQLEPTKRRMLMEKLKEGLPFGGIETLLPYFHDRLATITDYFGQRIHWIIIEPSEIKIAADTLIEELKSLITSSNSFEKIVDIEKLYDSWEDLTKRLALEKLTTINDFSSNMEQSISLSTSDFTTLRQLLIRQRHKEKGLTPLKEALDKWLQDDFKITIACHTQIQRERISDLIKWMELEKKNISIEEGELSRGFLWPEQKIAILTEADIFGLKIKRQQRRSEPLENFTSFAEMEKDDYLVHEVHGICQYKGLRHLQINSHAGDYLLLEFHDSDKLYLPVHNLRMVGRYIGPEESHPMLDRLGGNRFEKCKESAKKDIERIAKRLLEIYATRQVNSGHKFPSEDYLAEEFDAAFPYEETPDQLKAIDDVKADMENSKPMDRLICGDVGYGKTEVAMRAAFKAAICGKQVAILVPTTVLAFQHLETFQERFKNWPIKIKILSRFEKPKIHHETIEGIRKGTVDVIIGTHRLLQKDVEFKDLGLVIIDEEHRFGVKQKEKLKELRKTVDVIVMTATPIPRTLNLSLSGIRDLSLITTPPLDRLSISTHVVRFDEGIIKHAILKELERNGQVFFVHNRVQTIMSYFERLKKIVPSAKIKVAHGQMHEGELENVMFDFRHRKFDILLCTTIIESGLDIPSANTIIINRADKIGLAQLYQLRGRVGRSNVRAYAYLLIPEEEKISRTAQKRLNALTRYTELGSGFQIATHDMEIRGVGNILGESQSGHTAELGYELYAKLLERTVRRLKGEAKPEEINTELKLPVSAFIPESYISDPSSRIDIYKRLSSEDDDKGLGEISSEIIDRFGTMPKEVQNLIVLMKIRLLAERLMITSLSFDKGIISCQFHPSNELDVQRVLKLVERDGNKYRLSPPSAFFIRIAVQDGEETALLEEIKNSLSELSVYAINSRR